MEHQPVNSSNIVSTAHDPSSGVMEVKFKSGKVYSFPNVSADEHTALRNAPSVGKHFNEHFKGKHS